MDKLQSNDSTTKCTHLQVRMTVTPPTKRW